MIINVLPPFLWFTVYTHFDVYAGLYKHSSWHKTKQRSTSLNTAKVFVMERTQFG